LILFHFQWIPAIPLQHHGTHRADSYTWSPMPDLYQVPGTETGIYQFEMNQFLF
jgi:hypothetical protein